MKLERVGRVTVGDLALEVGRQVDDVDRLERAPFETSSEHNGLIVTEDGKLTFWGRYRNRCRALPR